MPVLEDFCFAARLESEFKSDLAFCWRSVTRVWGLGSSDVGIFCWECTSEGNKKENNAKIKKEKG